MLLPLLLNLGGTGWPQAYMDAFHDAARSPFWIVEIDQPRCSLTMGTAPCTATAGADGTRCYYTYHTCQDRENYDGSLTRTWRFTDAAVPVPPLVQAAYPQLFPILSKVSPISQTVDVENSFTRTDKITLTFHDIGNQGEVRVFDLDKSVRNTSRRGNFWKRVIAQWPNFRNAEVRLRRGFYSDTFAYTDLVTLWRGKLDHVKFDEKGQVVLECVDLLRCLEKSLPPKISGNNSVQTTISRSATSLVVQNASRFTDPATINGYVTIAAENADTGRREIMRVTARDTGTNTLTIVRGQYGTVADPHYEGESVWEVVVERAADGVGGLDPVSIMLDLMNRAGVPDADVDTGSFYRDGAWAAGMRFGRTIEEPTEIRKLVNEITELMAFGNCFVDEALKIRFAMLAAPAMPGESTFDVTDAINVLAGSGAANTNEKDARLTHCAVFFDHRDDDARASIPTADDGSLGSTSTADYDSIVIAVDAETYDARYYGSGEEDRREKKIKDAGAWILPGDFPQAQITAIRWVQKNAHAPTLFVYKAELRDDLMLIGSCVDVDTVDIQDGNGDNAVTRCRVIKKAHDADSHGFTATLRAIGGQVLDEANGGTKALRYAVAGPSTMAGTYDTSSATDKLYGYMGDADGLVGAALVDGYAYF